LGTEKTTKLYAEPKTSSPVVGVAGKGATVKAQTGEVHTKPGKLIIKRDVTTFRKDDILWVYTYLGEGYFKIWYQGKFIEDQIDFNYRNPAPDDWGRFEVMPQSIWWVKLRTPAGGRLVEPTGKLFEQGCVWVIKSNITRRST
jgi:hypothetical protein